MNPWWWLPIGLGAWFAVSVLVALALGLWLRSASDARDRAGAAFRTSSEGEMP